MQPQVSDLGTMGVNRALVTISLAAATTTKVEVGGG